MVPSEVLNKLYKVCCCDPRVRVQCIQKQKMFAKLLLELIVDRKNVTYLKIAYHEDVSCSNPTQMSCPRS